MNDNELGSKERFASNIKKLRLEKNLSIYRVSKDTGITYSFLRDLENAVKSPGPETIDKLAEYYETEIYKLFI